MPAQVNPIRTHSERAIPEDAPEILERGYVARVGFVENGRPCVIPMGYHFDVTAPESIYFHGAGGGRITERLQSGEWVSIAVTLLDGLVYSRTALYHSMNYRSVVCFGRGRAVRDRATQERVFEAMVLRYFPGRTSGRDYAAPTEAHLDATSLVEVVIKEWSAKGREGGPRGPLDAIDGAPGTCGVVQL